MLPEARTRSAAGSWSAASNLDGETVNQRYRPPTRAFAFRAADKISAFKTVFFRYARSDRSSTPRIP